MDIICTLFFNGLNPSTIEKEPGDPAGSIYAHSGILGYLEKSLFRPNSALRMKI